MSLNNSVLNVFKVSDEIVNRLFNHKPFIFGEIRFIIKELEEIRNESDFNQLLDTLQLMTDFKDSKMNFAIDSCHRFDEQLNSSVDSLNNLMKEILDLESDQSVQRSDALKAVREERNQEMISLVDVSKDKITEIDHQFEEQENNLKLYYQDLETKLRITPNSHKH